MAQEFSFWWDIFHLCEEDCLLFLSLSHIQKLTCLAETEVIQSVVVMQLKTP